MRVGGLQTGTHTSPTAPEVATDRSLRETTFHARDERSTDSSEESFAHIPRCLLSCNSTPRRVWNLSQLPGHEGLFQKRVHIQLWTRNQDVATGLGLPVLMEGMGEKTPINDSLNAEI